MKFQPIFIFLAIHLIDAFIVLNRLSVDDNKRRLETCGKKNYDKSTNDVISWGRGEVNGRKMESSATVISKRHVLTSSALAVDGRVDERFCDTVENKFIPLPEQYLKPLKFKWTTTGCKDDSCKKSIPITKAYLICNNGSWPNSVSFPLPMIVEIETSEEYVPFCLPTEDYQTYTNVAYSHYEYDRSNEKASSSGVMIKEGHSIELFTTVPYKEKGDRSGPLIAGDQKSKYYLIGIGIYGGHGKGVDKDGNEDKAWFYRAKWFTQGFCDSFGICHEGQEANPPSIPKEPKPEPTTEPPPEPTTEEPTIEEPTTEEPTTEKSEEPTTEEILIKHPEIDEPTTEKPSIPVEPEKPTNPPVSITTSEIHEPCTTKESPSPEPTMEPIPVIDLDQEYKEFKEREALDDKGDWDEWGNDFYRSADFFESSGKRIELFVGFLMVVMVVWRQVLG
ncbi:unnamed protein product [Caenorhabditis brenneri]